jgi:glutamate-5-semialdehyde dehydrogenase
LHGTGGAWIVASEHADAARLHSSIRWSLDRKVCNTVNCVALVRSRAADLVAPTLDALAAAAAARNANGRLHVVEGSETYVPAELFDAMIDVERAEGLVTEPQVSSLAERYLAVEWEWENSPEMTLVVVDSVEDAVSLFAEHSPHFVASLVSDDPDEHDRFYAAVDAPFVGDGFTRWVDGQYALDKPELGLSNWQRGRMLGRSGILSGDSVHTIRCRATITDPTVRR